MSPQIMTCKEKELHGKAPKTKEEKPLNFEVHLNTTLTAILKLFTSVFHIEFVVDAEGIGPNVSIVDTSFNYCSCSVWQESRLARFLLFHPSYIIPS
jgi:hypothetical protein